MLAVTTTLKQIILLAILYVVAATAEAARFESVVPIFSSSLLIPQRGDGR
jgi:hypothetical protein